MTGLNLALLTGRNSLLARQKQIDTIGHNIANADRPEYHRQTPSIVPGPALSGRGGQFGTGSYVEATVRAYDQALEKNLRQSISQDGYQQAYTEQIAVAELTYTTDGVSSLADAVMTYANAWQDLGSEPESGQVRINMIAQGEVLADEFNMLHNSITQRRDTILDASLSGTLATDVTQLNTYGQTVSELNKKISDLENRSFQPQNANDLRDQRDDLMQKISELTDVSVVAETDGTYTVELDGQTWIQGDTTPPEISVSLASGSPELVWTASGTTINLVGGECKGLIDGYAYMESLLTDTETYATELATVLNTQHAAGFDLDGNAGGALFDASTPGAMSFLISNPREIAASSVSGSNGDSEGARAMWDAMYATNATLSGDTLVNHSDRKADEIAIQVNASSSLAEGTKAQVEMYQDAISSVSGVNIDEEMLDMMEVQRAYQATAKFVGVIDEMLGAVLSMAG